MQASDAGLRDFHGLMIEALGSVLHGGQDTADVALFAKFKDPTKQHG